MKYIIFFYLMLISTGLNAALSSETSLGKRADGIHVNPASIPEPPLSKTKKTFLTQNKFGFNAIKSDPNWIIDLFLKEIKQGMVVLDVGSGYGALTRDAIDRGAIVISNDIDWKHLLYMLKHLTLEKRSRLHLNSEDIRKLELEENSLDLIIFDRILDFFKGDDIEAVLKKSFHWLKPNGKIYIVMMSNDHESFRNDIVYDSSKKWPGEDLVITKQHLPKQAYALPEKIHVMSVETLKPHLEKLGFQVEKADYVSLKKFTETDHDGKGAIGIIAVKK